MKKPELLRTCRVGYVLAQLAVVAVLALAAITVVRTHGPAISHDLRETLLWLTPERALRGAVVLALVMGAWSLGAGMSPPRARITGRVRLPVVALVGLIIVTAATFRLLLVRAATEPRVLGDELIYTGLAKSLALDGHLRFRGEPDLAHSLLYPLVLSPAYALAGDGARAFDVTKTINVILFTSAAIPAYLLARRVAGAGLAVAVAALVAFEPWSAYGSLVMTESLFLPAFTTFVLLLARMLEHCSRGRQLVVLVSLLALMAIRPQAYVLVAAVVGAIGISGVRAPPLTRALRAYRFLLVALGSGILLAILALGAGAAVPGGGAGDVAKTLLDPVALLKWSLWNLAVYELALGVVALVVFPLALYGLVRSPTDRVRATGIAMLTSSLAILLSVAAVSASPFGLDILHERYLFYVTPLVLVGLAYWLQAGVVPQRRVMWGAGVAAIALAVTLPTDQIARANNVDSPTATWVRTLDETWQDVPTKLVVVGVAALGALVLVRFRKATAPMLAVAVSFTAIVCWLDYSSPFGPGQDPQLAWVDRALPRGESVDRPSRALATRPAVRGGRRSGAAGPRRMDGVLQHAGRPRVPHRRAGGAGQSPVACTHRRAGRCRAPERPAVRSGVRCARLAPARGRPPALPHRSGLPRHAVPRRRFPDDLEGRSPVAVSCPRPTAATACGRQRMLILKTCRPSSVAGTQVDSSIARVWRTGRARSSGLRPDMALTRHG